MAAQMRENSRPMREFHASGEGVTSNIQRKSPGTSHAKRNDVPCGKPNWRTGAFTMVELLVVIAIIGVLAALLLPALNGGKQRAWRIVCVNQLRQTGTGFQSFAHDHNGKFAFEVTTNDGGSKEYASEGYLLNGYFYFEYRHYQPLAGFLTVPNILVCPTDNRRQVAADFNTLDNSNVSYFIGVSARYDQPGSILAGDGNLAASTTWLHEAAGSRLTWNRQLHEYKGNVLFSDAHVEEWRDTGGNAVASSTDIILPTLGGTDVSGGSGSGGGGGGGTGGRGGGGRGGGSSSSSGGVQTPSTPAIPANPSQAGTNSLVLTNQAPVGSQMTNQPDDQPSVRAGSATAASASTAGGGGHGLAVRRAGASETDPSNAVPENATAATNGAGGAVAKGGDGSLLMSPFDQELAGFLRTLIIGSYLLILLLLLLFVAYRIWRWYQDPAHQRPRRR